MFQNSAARLLVPAMRSAMQSRCQSVVSGPPTQRISTAVSLSLLHNQDVIPKAKN